MRYVASREEMQNIDAYSINNVGIFRYRFDGKGSTCIRGSLFGENTDR